MFYKYNGKVIALHVVVNIVQQKIWATTGSQTNQRWLVLF